MAKHIVCFLYIHNMFFQRTMMLRTFDKFKNWLQENDTVRNVVVRCDLNLPSNIEDLSRIYAIKDTVNELLSRKLNVILISHYKRPKKEDAFTDKFSLSQIASKISDVLQVSVDFIHTPISNLSRDSIKSNLTLLENLRFYDGEKSNEIDFARQLASFADVYINEAFSVSHRAHASVEAITKCLPSFAGISFSKEINGISKVVNNITRPYAAIIGGSKVSSKIDVLREISQKADYLIITGAMANTFLAASGKNLGMSLIEPECFEMALDIWQNSKAEIILPVDCLASANINENGSLFDVDNVPADFACFDIGSKSVERINDIINISRTLLWNGATGAFEFANFDASSKEIAKDVAQRTVDGRLISVIGGGETVASISNFKNDMTFVSTAGGAFLEYVSGYKLPGVVALTDV